jgi:phage FluMu protein Com
MTTMEVRETPDRMLYRHMKNKRIAPMVTIDKVTYYVTCVTCNKTVDIKSAEQYLMSRKRLGKKAVFITVPEFRDMVMVYICSEHDTTKCVDCNQVMYHAEEIAHQKCTKCTLGEEMSYYKEHTEEGDSEDKDTKDASKVTKDLKRTSSSTKETTSSKRKRSVKKD